MHTEIFNQIDLLVSMAGSTLNTDDIESELITINKEIQDKKQEMQDLKGMMNDTRYFNASSELVDKNIEVSLKSKISRLSRKIKDIHYKLDEVKKEEEKLHLDITSLKTRLEENRNYVKTLESKANANPVFQDIFVNEENHIKKLEEEFKLKSDRYNSVLKELELNNQALSEMTLKKDSEEARLKDIMDDLNNPKAYIDEDLKMRDEERLNSLQESLEVLQKRKLEYLTDPNMIGADVKELIINNDYTEALNKIKELLQIVKAKPYMDVANLSVLDDELEKKENERAELSNLIDSKNYKEMNSDAIGKRIAYIREEIESEQKGISDYQLSVQNIDQNVVANLSNLIKNLEDEIGSLIKEIEEYQTMIKDNSKTRKTKANLENTILKKEKEKEAMEGVLANYKSDLLFQINVSNMLSEMIDKFNHNIENYQKEMQELQRLAAMNETSKDFIEEEQDKEKLRNINEEIKQIKNRKKYTRTPDEIYDEIEMLLAKETSVEAPTTKVEVKEEVTIPEVDNLFTDTLEEQPRIKVVEMIPAQTVHSEATTGGATYGA